MAAVLEVWQTQIYRVTDPWCFITVWLSMDISLSLHLALTFLKLMLQQVTQHRNFPSVSCSRGHHRKLGFGLRGITSHLAVNHMVFWLDTHTHTHALHDTMSSYLLPVRDFANCTRSDSTPYSMPPCFGDPT